MHDRKKSINNIINVFCGIENMYYITSSDCGDNIASTDKFLKKMDLKLLGELQILTSISNLAEYGYESANKSLEFNFNP